MKREIKNIECEIVHQILICELCFDICNSIKIIPGRGDDFLPYYYNLNFIKGIISLHSLLLSKEKDELSIKNYISEYKLDYPKVNIQDFERKISSISSRFYKSHPEKLRHKIAAHIDEKFKHIDFTRAYIIPGLVQKYIRIVSKLKKCFFEFCSYSENDYPFYRIKKQSDLILKVVMEEDNRKLEKE